MKKGLQTAVMALLAVVIFGGEENDVFAETLSIVHVNAPAVNCKFDSSCKVVANDFVTDFAWSSSSNDSFLQSRTWPQGKPGTVAAGLYPYLYRIDLSKTMAVANYTCVTSFRIPFGPVEAVDYSGSGTANHVFVITSGGLGSIEPVTAVRDNFGMIDFTFQQPFCDGGQPGKGGMTFFFGLSSKYSSRKVTSNLSRNIGPTILLDSKAPAFPVLAHPPAPKQKAPKKMQEKP